MGEGEERVDGERERRGVCKGCVHWLSPMNPTDKLYMTLNRCI